MNAIAMIELGIALAVVAAALAAFNALVGKGPRGTVWIVAAAIFTWASFLPIGLGRPGRFAACAANSICLWPCCGFAGSLGSSWELSTFCSNAHRASGTRWPNRSCGSRWCGALFLS